MVPSADRTVASHRTGQSRAGSPSFRKIPEQIDGRIEPTVASAFAAEESFWRTSATGTTEQSARAGVRKPS